MNRLDVIAFAGASNWPLYAGLNRGFFHARGIELNVSLTPSSQHMARELHEGRAQIALTSIDNIIAYVEGHGEASLGGKSNFVAFMGVDDGLLSLMAQPEIGSIVELRGHTLAVDALTTGFAFVLRDLLSRAGLHDEDVRYAKVGSGAERLVALKTGECAATLLNAPLCLAAEVNGKRRLARAKDLLGRYQGIVGAARRDWAQAHREMVIAFISGFHDSVRWLAEPENKADACAILVERMPQLSQSMEAAYQTLIAKGGLSRSLEIDRAGVSTVIDLRRRYSPHVDKPLREPEAYIDDGFLLAALG